MSAERRYTDADVRADEELIELAHEYAEAYTGEFEPLVHARLALESGRILTTVEVRKVLNCMRNDWHYADKMPEPQAQIIQMPERRERGTVTKPKRDPRLAYELSWEERNKPCDSTDLHRSHNYEKKGYKYWVCDGVSNGRQAFNVDASLNVPFALAKGGKMIHMVARTARYAYFPNPYGWGYSHSSRAGEQWGYTLGPDLHVELVCRYPGWLKRPMLLTAEQATLLVSRSLDQFPLCKHCNIEITSEGIKANANT